MANTIEILPKGEYEISNVGPSRAWDFDGNDGKVFMATDQIQLKGYEQYWIDLNRAAKADPPKMGDKVTGVVTQDEAGKYNPKFVKEKRQGGGNWGGGGKTSPGAIWATNVQTAGELVSAFANLTGKKPASLDEFLKRVEATAPKVGAMVDRLVAKHGGEKPAEGKPDTASSESGESPAAASAANLAAKDDATRAQAAVIEDLSDDDLAEGW